VHPATEDSLKRRVVSAAEAALADHQYVSPIDVLLGTRLLESVHLQAWKKGRIDFLEDTIQANPSKVFRAISLFGEWAATKGLRPSETRYARSGLDGTVDLRFTESGDPGIETRYRTHYVSPALSEHKEQKIKEKLSAPAPPVVFQILRDSACSECGTEIERDDLLLMEAERPLCLACARLDDLEYLLRGDAAITRRATKYSGRTAVVVRFSRSRGRYERQGILVEVPALQRAEQECSSDAEDRARVRARSAQRRKEEDRSLVVRMTEEIEALFPGCPPKEAAAIAAHTAVRGSGRVGRTELAEGALNAAVAAAVRHRHTNYDELLSSGSDRLLAREMVSDRVREILAHWSGTLNLHSL
jgi:hypothetical protein